MNRAQKNRKKKEFKKEKNGPFGLQYLGDTSFVTFCKLL